MMFVKNYVKENCTDSNTAQPAWNKDTQVSREALNYVGGGYAEPTPVHGHGNNT